MESFEAWTEFRRGEHYEARGPRCRHCGAMCSGDVTDFENDREAPVCDEPEACPALA